MDCSPNGEMNDGGKSMTNALALNTTDYERSIWIPYGICILLSMSLIKNPIGE